MMSQLLLQEMVKETQRGREWPAARGYGEHRRVNVHEQRGQIGVYAAMGTALVWAGRLLQGRSLSRPTPAGSTSGT